MAKNVTNDPYAELMAGLSDEERAILGRLTGQDNTGGGGSKTPIVKINYREKTAADGTKVPKGNFCVGQKNEVKDGKTVLATAGTDLGETLEAVILKVGTQYSAWSTDPKKRCSSQVICERGEVPVGYNLKNVCNDKSCPRRKEGVEKEDKCVNQHVVYLRLPAGVKLPDGTDCPVAMFYVKGTSYKPFQEYMESLKGIPSIALTTKFKTTEEESGSTLFYVLGFEKGQAVPAAIFKENFAMVTGINNQLVEYKQSQATKMLEDKSSGSGSSEGGVKVINDDQITW